MKPAAFIVSLPDGSQEIGWAVRDRPEILTAEEAKRHVVDKEGAKWLTATVSVMDENHQWHD